MTYLDYLQWKNRLREKRAADVVDVGPSLDDDETPGLDVEYGTPDRAKRAIADAVVELFPDTPRGGAA